MVTFTVEGEELIKKEVADGGTSGRIYVPRKWIGCEVVIILLERGEEIAKG